MPTIPRIVQRQFAEMDVFGYAFDRAYAETHWPEALAWLRDNVSLSDLIADSGIKLKSLSPDAPNILIGAHACPLCGSDIMVVED